MRRRRLRPARGFSLTETVVALAVVGVLAALAFAAWRAVTARAVDEQVETQLVAVVRQAQAAALSRADGTVTEADWDAALVDTARDAEVQRWVAAADPQGDTDPTVRELAPPADGEIRVGFTAGRRHAAAAVTIRDLKVAMAYIPASGAPRVVTVDLDDEPDLEPTAAGAMAYLSGNVATVAYGTPQPAPTAESATTEPAPEGTPTAFVMTAAGDTAGVVHHLGTAAGTGTFTNPTGSGAVRAVASTVATGSAAVVVDRDTATTLTTETGADGSWTFDLTDRATLAPETVTAAGSPTALQLTVSTDGVTFERLDVAETLDGGYRVLAVAAPAEGVVLAWRYLRLSPAAGGQLELGEVELYGTLYETAPLPAAAPGGLVAAVTGGQVDLSWDAVAGASGYQVARGGASVATPTGTIASDVPPAGRHTYSVRAVVDGKVGDAATVTVGTGDAVPAATATWVADDLALTDGAAVTAWTDRYLGTAVTRASSAVRFDATGGPGGRAAVVFPAARPLAADLPAELTGGAFTYLAVVRWDGGAGGIVGIDRSARAWRVAGDPAAQQLLVDGRPSATDPAALTPGAWHVVAARHDGVAASTWTGTARTDHPASASPSAAGTFEVGAAGADRLSGAIAYLGLYDRALTDLEVSAAIDQLTGHYQLGP